MYLKRLEVFGFKTFAQRVELEFAPGITAIVGPNGAGKSNLADAVLWVFGEQSLKALRSSRSQDVIFSGSREKKPVGLAEVSLTLDNSNGRLDLDFPEVTVTRRVYRSGEGEYLLNRVPCRLRDIHDLFRDTGIGRQAYSIINQTQIDAVLSVRPEDRRELVEEAAGVSRYRYRKKETLRKLDATCANLLRVNDIIGELESQLEPLSRQSEQAREYSQISKELSSLKLSLLVSDYDSNSASLQRAKEKEAELEAEIESSRTHETRFAADEAALRAQLTQAEGKQDELRALVGRLTQETDRQEGQEALTREKISASERQRQGLEADLGLFEDNLREAKTQQQRALTQKEEIASKEAERLSALQEEEASLSKIQEEIANREKAVASARSEQLDLLGDVSERKNFHAQGASLLRTGEARMGRLQEEIAGAQRELESRCRTEAEKAREVEESTAILTQLQERLEELRSQGRQAAEKVEECEQAEETLSKQVLTARSRLEALEQLVRDREGLSPAARSLVGEGFPLLSDLLQAPAEVSLAIEAALGPWLEGLVCEKEADALRGRQWLRDNRGQAGFLLLEGLPAGSAALPSELREQPGLLGRAVDLVEFADKYRPLFEHLLGKVLLVEDLEAAFKLRRRVSPVDWRIVTLEGEMVFAAGMYLGKERESGGPLSRQAEIEDLERRLSTLEEESARAQKNLEEARASFTAVEEETTRTREDLAAAESKKTSAEEALALLRAEIQRERQRLEPMEAEQRGLKEEMERSRREQAALEQELLSLDEKQQAMQAGITASETELNRLRGQREAVARRIEEMKVAQASLAGERRAQEARIQGLGETQQSLTEQIHSRQESLRQLEKEKKNLEESLVSMGKHLESLRESCQKSQAELEAATAERQKVLEAIASHMENAKGSRDRREGVQASLHRLQLRITQLEGELSFLSRNLEEDYRISIEKAREVAPPLQTRKEAQGKVSSLQSALEALGTVNLGAMEEYERVKARLDLLSTQRTDLEKAREDLEKVIAEIDNTAREKFLECFHAVQKEFDTLFKRLFNGGETELRLSGEGEVLEAGIDVEVVVPGKRRQNLMLLSGGERALTAMAFVFSLLKVKPTPFVVLDEIDAPLDDSNVDRYAALLKEFSRESQFIIITHNKGTMEAADTLYGVTMAKAGVSTLISMKLTELPAA
ncbi:MAG: chromosome segregation protein SMC [Armatimonadetes bacterium]|nr:chromosome segregation protein SMC [Armatimonadota bacterium]NIM24010.1 chromosome segregation protein SMC [Armatimonadota bacterium]NIM67860.1 chromosome segregation protein SMC [Armatimonadota bacterium]NIM76391.1 chromosome segregation protein SMC [Armatimonadota bacterium]NIN06090.1 chromosome segregation protein SMC [Armatimonadota bacterium]